MGVKLVSASGGSVEINPPATASNFVATMPAGTGNVVVNGVNGALVSATAVASTSGTSIDFTGIPSWVKRVTVLCNTISTSGTSNIICRLGDSGGFVTTGYTGNITVLTNAAAVAVTDVSNALVFSTPASAANNHVAQIVWSNVSGNIWVGTSICRTSGTVTSLGATTVTLTNPLTQVRVTTGTGTDTFDAGSINILYE